MLNDGFQVFFVLNERDMLIVGWNTCIVGAKENRLLALAPADSAFMSGRADVYHEPHICRLRRRKELRKNLDGMSSCISSSGVC